MARIRILMVASAMVAVSPPSFGMTLTNFGEAGAEIAVSEDVPIPGGIAALARALDIDAPDRARCVAELVRLTYADPKAYRRRPESTFSRLMTYLAGVSAASPVQTPIAVDLVPMPLPAAVWSEAVFHRRVAPADLFAAVMSDASAAFLARGLAALDDETLRFLVEHPALVGQLYERDAAVFAAFAAHLEIRNQRVVPPGGDRAVPLWEALLEQQVTHPEGFVRELFTRDEGRLAYLYDTIGHLDSARAAFALGFWIDEAGVRIERFGALALAASSSLDEWDVTKRPFSRPPHDLLSMLSRIQVSASGVPGFPAERRLWARVFADGDVWEERRDTLDDRQPVDAAWLAQTLMSGHARWRMARLDQFAFGQRVFATSEAAALPDVVVAIRAFPRFHMLMLTLERIGVTRPSLYAGLARQAERVSLLEGIGRRAALAQFQGALALIARMARVQTINRATAETLLATMEALPFDPQRGYRGAFAPWLQMRLRPALGGGNGKGVEKLLLEALAGAPGQIPATPLSWEGQQYVFDFVAGEAGRLRRFRERQGGPSLDLALKLHRNGQRLAALASARRPGAALVAERVFELVDLVIADALLSFTYAADWNDQGAERLARDVARRHDFGFAKTSHEARVHAAWMLPAQVFDGSEPWRVQGSILGLDVALASLALRRINDAALTVAPTISTTERSTFIASLGLMNPVAMQDATQGAIAAAIARGQRRVTALGENGGDVTAVLREIAMDGWRARAVRWTLTHEPKRIASLFSMTDLLYLGGGRSLDVSPWGMSALAVLGCLCTHIPPPGHHTALVGRAHLGLLATTVADLNLRVAVTLHELQMPAALARQVLAGAVQDFIDHVKPSDPDDWLAFVRAAQGVSRHQIEDYLAAATSGGPLLPAPSAQRGRLP